MIQAKKGDRVTINFTGKLADGSIIDTTDPDAEEHNCGDDECGEERGPMELIIGDEEFYLPIEEALVGMAPGEKQTVTISQDDAFGDYDPENVFSVARSEFPDDLTPTVGMALEVTGEDDEVYMVTVVKVTDEEVSLDTNHPLAGEELSYEFELVEILS
ncbi:MAG: peptidylprolyl isomerase [Desulfuromonadaceae bacterium]|nr:peptidylprolyl isomerase [Desulfuromonadaceae bacterium]